LATRSSSSFNRRSALPRGRGPARWAGRRSSASSTAPAGTLERARGPWPDRVPLSKAPTGELRHSAAPRVSSNPALHPGEIEQRVRKFCPAWGRMTADEEPDTQHSASSSSCSRPSSFGWRSPGPSWACSSGRSTEPCSQRRSRLAGSRASVPSWPRHVDSDGLGRCCEPAHRERTRRVHQARVTATRPELQLQRARRGPRSHPNHALREHRKEQLGV
jgi:hypothetical protein